MKTNRQFISLAAILLMSFGMFFQGQSQVIVVNDSVVTGPSYANEVYYSMSNGVVSTYARDTWDIAFRTSIMSSSIITNDGTNVVLWSYPNADTSGWNTLDTNGLSTWTPLYNDPLDWENGAFSRQATGHPDYGWGVYNATTHNLKGDSLFIIKLRNDSYRKLWIVRKLSSLNTYVFRFAYLDGSGEQEITLDCSTYNTKDFVGYNLAMNVVVDFQPPKADWDIVFTKYMSVQPNLETYPVTGVLSNENTLTSRFDGVDTSFFNWGVQAFYPGRSSIGWDWKVFDLGSMSYQVVPDLVFFLQPASGDVYRLVFTKFAGSSSGKVVMKKALFSLAGIEDENSLSAVTLFPNPTAGQATLRLAAQNGDGEPTLVTVRDVVGKTLWQTRIDTGSTTEVTLPSHSWPKGMYLVNVSNGQRNHTKKLVIQ